MQRPCLRLVSDRAACLNRPAAQVYILNMQEIGFITREDYLRRHGGGVAWERHFARMDRDGDGQIDAREYHTGRHALQVGNAVWGGTRLRHILLAMGLDESKVFETDQHGRFKKQWYVQLTGADGFSLSVPLEVCIRYDRDVLLATSMNGEAIPEGHSHLGRLKPNPN